MELVDARVVVTGAGSGIGAAIAERALAEGAEHVIAADVDAEALADRMTRWNGLGFGSRCSSMTVDVSQRANNHRLVADAIDVMGGIDLFVANAGVATGQGPDAPEDVWERTWRINTMAHVWAFQALLPGWLSVGEGYLVTTASAAGLLTNLGDAPYSVTKAAAVAFADWAAITYGDRGIRVSCLCPQGVRTPLLFGDEANLGSSDDESPLAAAVVKSQRIIEPTEVADAVVAGLRAESMLILPHPEVRDYAINKASDRDGWIGALRRMQRRLTAARPSD